MNRTTDVVVRDVEIRDGQHFLILAAPLGKGTALAPSGRRVPLEAFASPGGSIYIQVGEGEQVRHVVFEARELVAAALAVVWQDED